MDNADPVRPSLACCSAIFCVMSCRPSGFTSVASMAYAARVRFWSMAERCAVAPSMPLQADGAAIVTVEGLAEPGTLNEVQRAFAKHHALQCGFCTAGILCSVTHFLRDTPAPDEQQVREMLSGHICRCTGYAPIVAAVLEAAIAIGKGS